MLSRVMRASGGAGAVKIPVLYRAGIIGVLMIVLLILPRGLDAEWLRTLTEALLFAFYAQCWNLSTGLAGVFSLAHPVFVAIGGYGSALLLIHLGWTPWVGMLLGGLIAAGMGSVMALITARVGISGIYFALFTIAVWTVLTAVVVSWGLLGKNAGLLIPRSGGVSDFNVSDAGYYYIIFAFVIICAILTYKILRSRLGLSLLSYRDDPDAARASGVGAVRAQVTAIAISAFMTALAGAFYAMYYRFVSPSDVLSFSITEDMILGTMVGGLCTVTGPIIGGLVFGVLSDVLRQVPILSGGTKGDVFTTAVYAVVLILTVRFLPGGLVSLPRLLLARWRTRFAGDHVRDPSTEADVAARSPAGADADDGPRPTTPSKRSPVRAESAAPILTAKGLSKQIGGLRALDGVDITIGTGQVLAIIGPNGAGKTTLFNCLTGFTQPTSGTVDYEGRSIVGCSPNVLCKRGLGRTFQIAKPFPAMSALNAVAVAARLHVSSYSAARDAAAETLRRVEFKASYETLGADLSNVNRKRLEVARALAGQPRLLLLDEVCAGLSEAEVRDFTEVLRSIVDSGITILMVEHVLSAVVALADRVQVLNYGRTIAEGRPGDVMSSQPVVEAYLGSSTTARNAINLARLT